jgi:hypothetical protein
MTATLTRNGNPVSSQIVDFALSNTAMGTLTAASGVTSATGTVTTTFQAGATIGAVGITATHSGSGASNTLALGLTQPPATTPGGIQFVSASPLAVGVVGSGQPTTSSVNFRVTNASGGAAPGATVNFTMTGPVGAYIGAQDGSPGTATGITDSAGNVSVPLNAGTAAGPVTITASVTVSGTTFTTSTSVMSIGGAVPSHKWFSLATSRKNLPGMVLDGFEATLSVLIADRFSNFNILEGTQVSFFTEAGAVDTSVNVDDTGRGSVTIRTQNPRPVSVASFPPTFATSANPLSGHLAVIAVVRGEEAFNDVNGNGVYDPGTDQFDVATMDLGEPYIDANDNGVRDAGEQFVDANSNGVYDGPNGIWDGPGCTQLGCNSSPAIWREHRLMFTGHLICETTATAFALGAGGSQAFSVTLRDSNFNAPVPGTTVTISVSGATVSGGGTHTVLDTTSNGPFVRTFTISDPNPTATASAPATITLTASTPGGEGVDVCTNFPVTISGTTQ